MPLHKGRNRLGVLRVHPKGQEQATVGTTRLAPKGWWLSCYHRAISRLLERSLRTVRALTGISYLGS
jgi:hypothetical protein